MYVRFRLGVIGDAWNWRRRLFAWKEGFVREYVDYLSNDVLQDEMVDEWVWKLHLSQHYTVERAYSYLTVVAVVDNGVRNHVLWLKVAPLKVNIFVWRLFLNRLATKDNMHRRHNLANTDNLCSIGCDNVEDQDHLFFQYNFSGQLWYLTSGWLGITFVSQGELHAHSIQFGGLGGFSKKSHTTFNIVSISVLFIILKEHNKRIFNNMTSSLLALLEMVKFQAFWWLKSNLHFV